MSSEARILFQQIFDGVDSLTRETGSAVRGIIDTSKLPPTQQRELQLALRDKLQSLVWHILGRFDNVGCTLPPGVWGFRILAQPYAEDNGTKISLAEVDIRQGEADYADMWQDWLLELNRLTLPELPPFLSKGPPAPDGPPAE